MKTARITLGVLVLSLAVQGALAESLGKVRLKYHSVDPGKTARFYKNGSYLGYISAGTWNLKVDMGYAATGEGIEIQTMAASNNDLIGGYCVELAQSRPSSYYYTTYDVIEPESGPFSLSASKSTHLRRLFDMHLDDVTGDTSGAAFQMAVWEIIYETSGEYELNYYDYGDRGSFFAKDGTSITLANTWLADVVAGTGNPDIRLRILTDPCKQDYAMILPEPTTPGDPVIPEPLTLVALTAGVGGLGGYLKKRFATKVV